MVGVRIHFIQALRLRNYLYDVYLYMYILRIKLFFGVGDLVRSFFCLGRSMRFAELEFSVENSFVRAPPSGDGSNAPRPAVSVPHIDVNADGCRARQARRCKNTACRGGISEILVES